jgi:transposase-like protein
MDREDSFHYNDLVGTMEIEKSVLRKRKHAEEFKQAVVDARAQPGAPISGIALANDINPNLVHRWMRERGVSKASVGSRLAAVPELAFIPIQIAPTISEQRDIRIKVRSDKKYVWYMLNCGKFLGMQ